ncbi:hypothetical protein B566_EDAN006628 [Ephemera danica]|nr:hypothetical protein B566_EDAN006628 [Ephemera danica]
MRDDVEKLITSAARALRNQANAVEAALERRIAETDECLHSLEDHLNQTERLMSELRLAIANHGIPLRVAHTRLDTRLQRPGVECCRDEPQHGLLNEVRRVEDTLSALRTRHAEAECSLAELVRVRERLEHNIRIERHSLTVDRGRCRELRLAFPSTVHLTGY